MAVVSKYMGRTTLLTVLALIAVAASLSQPWWEAERTSQWTGARTDVDGVEVYDDHFVTYSEGQSGKDTSSTSIGYSEDLETLFANLGILSGLWIILGVVFLIGLLLNSRWLGLVFGGAAVAVGALAVIMFVLLIGGAVSQSSAPIVEEIGEDVGFSGSYYTNSTYGTMTYVYGPSVGFYLTALALSLQIAAYVIRSFAASDPATVVETRPDANIDSGPGLPPEIAVFSETDISAPPLSEPKDRT